MPPSGPKQVSLVAPGSTRKALYQSRETALRCLGTHVSLSLPSAVSCCSCLHSKQSSVFHTKQGTCTNQKKFSTDHDRVPKAKSIKCKQPVNISNTSVDSNNVNDHRDNSQFRNSLLSWSLYGLTERKLDLFLMWLVQFFFLFER